MENESKSRKDLLEEIKALTSKLTNLEKSQINHKSIEDALLLQKAWFEELFKNISHGIAILDPNDHILNVNEAFKKMYQYSFDEVFGKRLNEVIIPKDLFDEGRQLSLTTFKGNIADRETVRRRKDGTLVNVRILGVPIHVDGVIKSIFAIYEDITERLSAENARIKESELRVQTAELNVKVAESQALAAEAQAKAIKAENERKTYEFEEARKLQLSMLPKNLPSLPGLDISVYMKTATEVGGDYYDFQVADDGTLLIAIGDATGHGLKAGTMVTIIKSLFYADAISMNIIPFFEKCTNNIKKMQISNLYMGLTIAKIRDNKMIVSSAGMPPLYLYKAGDGKMEKIVFKSMPLGAFTNFLYDERSVQLEKGDTLLLLTDGLPELFNERNDILDYQKLEEFFQKSGYEKPDKIIERLIQIGEEWNQGKNQNDDITFIVIKIKDS
jgi:PAS domain S-box-containing protein